MPARLQRLLLGAVLVAALAIRLWRLGEIPTVFCHDECDNTVNAIQILNGKGPGFFGLDWKPQPALAVHVLAATFAAVGPSIAAVRLPSAALSVVALLPFFFLARRATGTTGALLGIILLAADVGYLHFSRSGWENAQICLWTLLAMAAARRGEERGSGLPWAVAGLAAAVATVTYFAGRAVIAFLLLYLPIATWRTRARGPVLRGAVILLLAYAVVLGPYLPTILRDWDLFMQRTQTVFFMRELPPDAGVAAVAVQLGRSAVYAGQTTVRGEVNNQPRYFPVGRPLFDPLVNVLFALGLLTSWRAPRETLLWWLALLVPFGLTQMLTTPSRIPDLARGIAMVPVAYLFVALGCGTVERAAGKLRRLVMPVVAAAVAVSAVASVRGYFAWARSDDLARPLEPAVQRTDFPYWWAAQEEWARNGRGFLNVDTWKQLRPARVPGARQTTETALEQ